MNNEQILEKIKEEGNLYEFQVFGMPAKLIRNRNSLCWCGYVGVPKDSILDGVDYSHYCDCEYCNAPKHIKQVNGIRVHGGLTYARREDGIWYFGFDTAHAGDWMSYPYGYGLDKNSIYRDKEYCIEQCKSLAKQLTEILKENNQ